MPTKEDFDVVISDVHMPVLDGLKFFEKLRTRKPYVPFVFFSGNADVKLAAQFTDPRRFRLCRKADRNEQA